MWFLLNLETYLHKGDESDAGDVYKNLFFIHIKYKVTNDSNSVIFVLLIFTPKSLKLGTALILFFSC